MKKRFVDQTEIMIRDHATLNRIAVPDDYKIGAPIILGYPESIPAISEQHPPIIVKVM